ncbi:dephospho-CoA kinase [Cryomorpha ignava]|uniref:Dephospho-CoA kinase n=2 Tax=Cryomorpha ignava TaxID=101383 RepID=A0A7K3WPI8_9FLAO|nr:dephospho-CoA kinase [Cryomorpha ignava]
MSKPLVIGLTGGIGAGKSLVAKIFESLGVPVFNADLEGREILNSSAEVRKQIIDAFGESAYSGSQANRPFLAVRVFKDEALREKLNAIVHPAVADAFDLWISKSESMPYVLKEAAITFETGLYKSLDGVILVTAPKDVRISRVMKRDGVTENQVLDRMAAQWSDGDKLKLSDYQIDNDGKTLIIPQVLRIHDAISQRA